MGRFSVTYVLLVPCVARKHCLVQAPGPGLTVVLLTFNVLAQGGGFGTRPWCWFVCLWRRLLASRHCTSQPTVGLNVFWLCQRSPWMTCPVAQGRGGYITEDLFLGEWPLYINASRAPERRDP